MGVFSGSSRLTHVGVKPDIGLRSSDGYVADRGVFSVAS